MYGIIDSATNLVAVQGADCEDCEGQTYDISSSVESGTARIEEKYEKDEYGES